MQSLSPSIEELLDLDEKNDPRDLAINHEDDSKRIHHSVDRTLAQQQNDFPRISEQQDAPYPTGGDEDFQLMPAIPDHESSNYHDYLEKDSNILRRRSYCNVAVQTKEEDEKYHDIGAEKHVNEKREAGVASCCCCCCCIVM